MITEIRSLIDVSAYREQYALNIYNRSLTSTQPAIFLRMLLQLGEVTN